MGLVFGRGPGRSTRSAPTYFGIAGPADLIPRRVMSTPFSSTNANTAMTNSVVWAALRLRADLVSTMPYGTYRNADLGAAIPGINLPSGIQKVPANASPIIREPRGFMEFLYSSQVELDRSGNAIGTIDEVDSHGLPTVITLASSSCVDVVIRDNRIYEYRINGNEYPPDQIWHEKQFTVAGLHVGMSPVAFSAYQSGLYQSIQEFAAQWFTSGQGPRASPKNNAKKLSSRETSVVKEAWRASQAIGEPFVHGSDWEYNLYQAQSASTDWIEAGRMGQVDMTRFYGVPADLLDAAVSGQSINYANVTQRNLQFLIMHLGPAIRRREVALSELMPKPRFLEFDTNALLRMDPETRALWIKTRVDSRTLTLNEGRAMDNLPPLTDDDYKQWELAGLNKTATGALTGADNLPAPTVTQSGTPSPAQNDDTKEPNPNG